MDHASSEQLVYASSAVGIHYLQSLREVHSNYSAVALSADQQNKLLHEGIERVMLVNPDGSSPLPHRQVCKFLIFSDYTDECCKLLQFGVRCGLKPIYVVTSDNKPMLKDIYKQLGASYIIHSNGCEAGFLVHS